MQGVIASAGKRGKEKAGWRGEAIGGKVDWVDFVDWVDGVDAVDAVDVVDVVEAVDVVDVVEAVEVVDVVEVVEVVEVVDVVDVVEVAEVVEVVEVGLMLGGVVRGTFSRVRRPVRLGRWPGRRGFRSPDRAASCGRSDWRYF